MKLEDLIRREVKRLVHDLVSNNFGAIVPDGRGGGCTEEELKAAVDGYPGRLTMPPEAAFEKLDIIRRVSIEDPTFHVDFDMWVLFLLLGGGHVRGG